MDKELFEKYYRVILAKAAAKRREKEKEYFSEQDVLLSLRNLARFRNKETPQMIMDLVSKPIMSLSDMINAEFGGQTTTKISEEQLPIELWEEKFVDTFNYLFKLYACIREEKF
jgi:hypothetical protein